ncbi:UxaA family hydrolase [Mesorhizobium sp. BAC0120]|uniref:UxaA family hydrolase n=1 Tax=Mesorhizobium sp. BAC0120 TaxID=3090670 RepID=UPI00298CC3AC|nr:UxaA family hydrolase [Mesorhizobium sp. BAC0120]MDW6020766.1 UxaA family hydrolase [Mesorhizobium sp. BAC0120]
MAGPDAPPADQTDGRLLLLSDADNVLVARRPIAAGETIFVSGVPVRTSKEILLGHKVARQAIAENDKVRKYGAPIGSAIRAIAVGEHVHIHNMKSDYTRTHVIDASDEEKSR